MYIYIQILSYFIVLFGFFNQMYYFSEDIDKVQYISVIFQSSGFITLMTLSILQKDWVHVMGFEILASVPFAILMIKLYKKYFHKGELNHDIRPDEIILHPQGEL